MVTINLNLILKMANQQINITAFRPQYFEEGGNWQFCQNMDLMKAVWNRKAFFAKWKNS